MRDLVTTSKQADLCFDCHIGNRKRKQFVTHEMYAAGHPPLPSIELQTFCEQMPQHWRSVGAAGKNLSPPERSLFHRTNYPGLENPDETYWDTRKLMIGALTARKKTLDLLIDSSELDLWADYSLYDCTACHHELKSESKRQQRGYVAAPGRPRQPEWTHLPLMQLETFLPSDVAGIAELEQRLAHSIAARPFGDESRVVRDAMALRDRLQSAIEEGEKAKVDRVTATEVLLGLLDTPVERILTYDAARQVVWATRAIAKELKTEGQGLPENVDQMIADLDEPTAGQGRTGIATQLPAGRSEFIYERGLRDDLERRAAFDPDQLAKRLHAVAAALRQSLN